MQAGNDQDCCRDTLNTKSHLNKLNERFWVIQFNIRKSKYYIEFV